VGAEERLERRGRRCIGRGGDRHLIQGGQVTDRYRKKGRMRDRNRERETMRGTKIGQKIFFSSLREDMIKISKKISLHMRKLNFLIYE
jgi:hypothetical protein